MIARVLGVCVVLLERIGVRRGWVRRRISLGMKVDGKRSLCRVWQRCFIMEVICGFIRRSWIRMDRFFLIGVRVEIYVVSSFALPPKNAPQAEQ